MIRRIAVAAFGGIAGFCLLYAGVASLHAVAIFFLARLWPLWLLVAVGCGGFAMWVGEKLGVVPSDEELNKKLGPVSLFSQKNSNSL